MRLEAIVVYAEACGPSCGGVGVGGGGCVGFQIFL